MFGCYRSQLPYTCHRYAVTHVNSFISTDMAYLFFFKVKKIQNGNIRRISSHAGTGFPLGLEKLENLEKWEGIFQSGKSQGILNRLEKSGKSQGKPHKILEN